MSPQHTLPAATASERCVCVCFLTISRFHMIILYTSKCRAHSLRAGAQARRGHGAARLATAPGAPHGAGEAQASADCAGGHRRAPGRRSRPVVAHHTPDHALHARRPRTHTHRPDSASRARWSQVGAARLRAGRHPPYRARTTYVTHTRDPLSNAHRHLYVSCGASLTIAVLRKARISVADLPLLTCKRIPCTQSALPHMLGAVMGRECGWKNP